MKRQRRQRATGRKHNPARTREAILQAAVVEFCDHGFTGARVESISTRSGTNMRLLYHYFGNKQRLYTAVLDRVYTHIRAEEQRLDLGNIDPIEGMGRLIDFTFAFFAMHADYISLLNNENMLRGRFVKKSRAVRPLTLPLLAAITDLLERGYRAGVFRSGIDPIQLYVSITALSYFHVSNRYTLSAMFGRDLSHAAWLKQRGAHAHSLILTWLSKPGANAPAPKRSRKAILGTRPGTQLAGRQQD